MKSTGRFKPALFVALAVLLVLATAASAGIYYESRSVTGEPGKKRGDVVLVHSWVDGKSAKVLFTDADRGMMQDGSYLLTNDGGETLYLVNPKDENYFRWSRDGMFAGLGAIMEGMGGMFNMDFSEAHYEKLSDEPGGDLLGRPTRKVTSVTSYVMDMKVLGVRRHDSVKSELEAWIAESLTDLGLSIWLNQKPPTTGNEEFDALLQEGWEAMQGFPLRTRTTTHRTNKKDKTTTSVSSMDVTVLREEDIPESTFVLDPDYKEIELPFEAMGAGGEQDGDGKKKKKGGGFLKRLGRLKNNGE